MHISLRGAFTWIEPGVHTVAAGEIGDHTADQCLDIMVRPGGYLVRNSLTTTQKMTTAHHSCM